MHIHPSYREKLPRLQGTLKLHLQGLHVLYNTLTCTLNPYQPSVGPVASRSLFFDVQILTLTLGKYTLFARANFCYPTARLRLYLSTVFAAHLLVYTRTTGCKRSLRYFVKITAVGSFV